MWHFHILHSMPLTADASSPSLKPIFSLPSNSHILSVEINGKKKLGLLITAKLSLYYEAWRLLYFSFLLQLMILTLDKEYKDLLQRLWPCILRLLLLLDLYHQWIPRRKCFIQAMQARALSKPIEVGISKRTRSSSFWLIAKYAIF